MIHITQPTDTKTIRARIEYWKCMRGELPPRYDLPALPARTLTRTPAPAWTQCAYPGCRVPFVRKPKSRRLYHSPKCATKAMLMRRYNRQKETSYDDQHKLYF